MLYLQNFTMLFIESAPWLLLGMLIAGLMKWMVPISLLQKHMGNNKVTSIVKAAVIGAPLPLCSCGVIPAAIGLRRAGASKSSTVSFLVATPETGVDSISVSYALLGPFFAIIRPLSAIFTAIYTGLLVKTFAINKSATATSLDNNNPDGCCSSKKAELQNDTKCCSGTPEKKVGVLTLISNSISFASGQLLSDITKWLLIGLLLAAAIKTWVATDFLLQWGDGFLAMVIMAVIGVPMYICATASTPLAAGFLAAGLSPGAILVFMLAGPATNVATMGMIRQEMGTPVLIAYLTGLLSASIGLGFLTNWLVNMYHISIPVVAASEHMMDDSIIHQLTALLLVLLMARNWLKSARILTVNE